VKNASNKAKILTKNKTHSQKTYMIILASVFQV